MQERRLYITNTIYEWHYQWGHKTPAALSITLYIYVSRIYPYTLKYRWCVISQGPLVAASDWLQTHYWHSSVLTILHPLRDVGGNLSQMMCMLNISCPNCTLFTIYKFCADCSAFPRTIISLHYQAPLPECLPPSTISNSQSVLATGKIPDFTKFIFIHMLLLWGAK